MPVSVVCSYACVLSVHIPVQHTCEYMFISLCMCTCASVYLGMYVCLVCALYYSRTCGMFQYVLI